MPTNPTPGPGVDFVTTLTSPEIRPDQFTAHELPSPSSCAIGPLEQLADRVERLSVGQHVNEKWLQEVAALVQAQAAQIQALTARVAALERGQGEPRRIGGGT